MNLGEFYNYVNYLAEKEKSGNTMSPDEFQNNLSIINMEFANELYSQYEVTGEISDNIRCLEVHMGGDSMPLTIDNDGFAMIPPDYYHYSSISYLLVTGYDGETPIVTSRNVAVLTDAEFNIIRGRALMYPSKKYPVCTFRNGRIQFLPRDLRKVEFSYLKKPTEPFFDYYISSIGEVVYMLPNQSYMISSPAEYRDGTTGLKNSLSVEMDWSDNAYPKLTQLMLSKIGISIKDRDLIQYSELNQNKPNQS